MTNEIFRQEKADLQCLSYWTISQAKRISSSDNKYALFAAAPIGVYTVMLTVGKTLAG